MAVPKKRTSKSKKNKRKTVWKAKAIKQSLNAISLANLQKYEDTKTN
uniref:Large ribosomal subunit protein bL32c n=1 Tax=Halochlorococcum sp. NIES-1838 TaxID=2249730 RepID=A0A2Z4MA05_9CHLO|nr:ribosomal protein L32 [Halochlorococcum sp. NIES-1838]